MATITWDIGTAYDLFISLFVLHHAVDFGLRPSWAAGVRQRMPAPQRDFLERMYTFSGAGLEWTSRIPKPKSPLDFLELARGMEPRQRFEMMFKPADMNASLIEVLKSVSTRGSATQKEIAFLKTHYIHRNGHLPPVGIENLVRAWSDPEAWAEQFLEAFQEYHQVFFSEEEQRLRPLLEQGLVNAQNLAARMPVEALIESLSHGVRIENFDALCTLTLAPSYWCSPLVFHLRPQAESLLLVFGVRSPMESVVPGAGVPELLVNALKSLADPTRLRILRYLHTEPLHPAELARRLRLRPPTVIHHLNILRLAGLVQITVNEKNERRYAARLGTLIDLNGTLRDYLTGKEKNV